MLVVFLLFADKYPGPARKYHSLKRGKRSVAAVQNGHEPIYKNVSTNKKTGISLELFRSF
jgi:hypothetical protein